jgi:hypothetical protein
VNTRSIRDIWNDRNYSARIVQTSSTNPVVERLNRYVDKLLDKTAERLAPRVVDRIADQLDTRIATLEVLLDPEALEDLRDADETPDDALIDYEDVRREVGLA